MLGRSSPLTNRLRFTPLLKLFQKLIKEVCFYPSATGLFKVNRLAEGLRRPQRLWFNIFFMKIARDLNSLIAAARKIVSQEFEYT